MNTGRFVISLDFELYWGMTDKVTLKEYGENILGVRKVIPRMLALFQKYDIAATWGIVGMLTFESKEELLKALPAKQPQYENPSLSNYTHLSERSVEEHDQYYFGASLVREIQTYPRQEIASHTFSHYYCREAGQNAETFRADCEAQQNALARLGVTATSLILPRNQWREEYLPTCREFGITAFRGNQRGFAYAPRNEKSQTSPFIRALRLLDHYLPLFGAHTHTSEEMQKTRPYNIPASIFFRPYTARLRFLEPLRLWRIKSAMTVAAKEGKLFHLWWHPHNFGKNIEQNLQNLEEVLKHYTLLQKRYGMESRSMQEVAGSLESL